MEIKSISLLYGELDINYLDDVTNLLSDCNILPSLKTLDKDRYEQSI